ncbi:hypothetical protein KSC_028600 [Ktedonobacter sp. SOSP1-52]|uniref:WD40 repeat domain-containing protein n=1 Tax=Ktedonobacter sp. SOSP1-52 TaxID=2778366 RepID=UPI00191512ED|nr:PD40 domain-containing protein [Ktedonobacter sp. SOSP1-52]GHO63968.1 hypothetical protein KSC_028600 [Ktedonobacter sp. SOSP1-52]
MNIHFLRVFSSFHSHLYKRLCFFSLPLFLILLAACGSPASSAQSRPIATATRGQSHKALKILNAQHKVNEVQWSPDGQFLALLITASEASDALPNTLEVWNVHRGQMLWRNVPAGQNVSIGNVDWSPDSQLLAFDVDTYGNGPATTTIQVARVQSGQISWSYQSPSPSVVVNTMQWSPDSKRLAVDFGSQVAAIGIGLRVFDALSGTSLAFNPKLGQQPSIAWSPDSTSIAAFSTFQSNGDLVLWNFASGSTVSAGATTVGGGGALAWSPDGKRLAFATESSNHILDLSTKKALCTFQVALEGPISSFLSWSADSQRLLNTGYEGSGVQAWNGTTCSSLLSIQTQRDPKNSGLAALLAPDTTHVALAYPDNSIHVLDATNKTTLLIFTGHTQLVNSLAWSSDSTLVASASSDGTVQIWKAL